MRKTMMLAVLAIGCSGEVNPVFVDDAQEVRYLSTLPTPTPEQFARREALEKKALDRKHRIVYHESVASGDRRNAIELEANGNTKEALTYWRQVKARLQDYPDSKGFDEAVMGIYRLTRR